jgi:hypothetical protein
MTCFCLCAFPRRRRAAARTLRRRRIAASKRQCLISSKVISSKVRCVVSGLGSRQSEHKACLRGRLRVSSRREVEVCCVGIYSDKPAA